MKYRPMALIAALADAVATGGVASAAALKSAALAKEATVSLGVARQTALKARAGTIASDGKPYEVGVDARTGAVLENVAEGRNPD